MLTRHFLIILSAALILPSMFGGMGISGQAPPTPDDYDRFIQAGGESIPIYRGKISLNYNFLYNGFYTWDLDGYQRGDVMFKGKLYRNVPLEINANLQQVLMKFETSIFSIELDRESVEYFTRGTRRWDNLHDYGHPEAPEGYFEQLYSGRSTFYKRIDKEFKTAIDPHPDLLGPIDKEIDSRVTNYFEHKQSFYLLTENGSIVRIKNSKGILRLHKDKKRDILQHMRTRNIPEKDLARWGTEAIKYLEENYD